MNEPRTGHGVAMVVLACVAAALLHGCGASSLERHARAATALHVTAELSADAVDAYARERMRNAQSEEQIDAILDSVRPAEAAQHLFADAVDAYVLAVTAAAAEESPDLAEIGTVAFRTLLDMWELLEEVGVDLPDLPIPVTALGALIGVE